MPNGRSSRNPLNKKHRLDWPLAAVLGAHYLPDSANLGKLAHRWPSQVCQCLVNPVSLASFDVIVLTAGSSRRFPHGNKLAVRYQGAPLITGILQTIAQLDFRRCIIVTGQPYRNEIVEILGAYPGWLECFNANASDGMARSIAIGAAAVEGSSGVFICPADMPGIGPLDFHLVASAFAGPDSICRPNFRGRPGHPVLFGSAYFAALRALTGDEGASSLVRQFQSRLIALESGNRGVTLDFDTAYDFEKREQL